MRHNEFRRMEGNMTEHIKALKMTMILVILFSIMGMTISSSYNTKMMIMMQLAENERWSHYELTGEKLKLDFHSDFIGIDAKLLDDRGFPVWEYSVFNLTTLLLMGALCIGLIGIVFILYREVR